MNKMDFSMVNPRLIDFEEERLKCKQCSYFSNFSGGCTFVKYITICAVS